MQCPAREGGACTEECSGTPSHSTLQAILELETWGFRTSGTSIVFLLLLGVGLEKHEKAKQTLGKGQIQRREDQKSSVVFDCPMCLPKATGKLTAARAQSPDLSQT